MFSQMVFTSNHVRPVSTRLFRNNHEFTSWCLSLTYLLIKNKKKQNTTEKTTIVVFFFNNNIMQEHGRPSPCTHIRWSGYRTLLFIKEEKIPTITSVRDACVCREEKNGRLDPEEKYVIYIVHVWYIKNNNILYDKYLIFIDRTKRIGRGVPIICITLYIGTGGGSRVRMPDIVRVHARYEPTHIMHTA